MAPAIASFEKQMRARAPVTAKMTMEAIAALHFKEAVAYLPVLG